MRAGSYNSVYLVGGPSRRNYFLYFYLFLVVAEFPAAMEATSTISHKAEIFQSKLIENFQLLETFSEQGRKRAPVYNSTDILGKCNNYYAAASQIT